MKSMRSALLAGLGVLALTSAASASTVVENPWLGITYITRSETAPRNVNIHVVEIDLTAPGIGFKLSPHTGARDTYRQTTTAFLNQEQAQVGINTHFFDPVTNSDFNVNLAGLAISNGSVVSPFEGANYSTGFATNQSYAIVPFGAALNIDPSNQVSIVHRDAGYADDAHVQENVTLWNALEGSAQIITDGVKTVPVYQDATHPDGLLTPLNGYSNGNSWYNLARARSAIGFTQDGKTLVLFTVDAAPAGGMSAGEVADILMNDYNVYNALNLDGGGSTCLAMEDPVTHVRSMRNLSGDAGYPNGRPEGSNLAVFALPVPEPATLGLLAVGGLLAVLRRKR